GRWLFCSGEPSNTLDQSIEFTADGQFFILSPDGQGGFVREVGFDKAGTFVLNLSGLPRDVEAGARDASLSPAQTVFYVHLYYNSSPGSLSSNLSLSSMPRKMLFGPSTYVPIP